MKRSRIFLDAEFTKLHKNADIISIGLITETDRMFYAESTSFGIGQCNDWVKENVLPNLILDDGILTEHSIMAEGCGEIFQIKSSIEQIAYALRAWLPVDKQIEVWGDCLSYDWVLFCDLFGGAEEIPKNIHYIPFDIATLFKAKGLDPDLDREDFTGLAETKILLGENVVSLKKHNALRDAVVIKECHNKLSLSEKVKLL